MADEIVTIKGTPQHLIINISANYDFDEISRFLNEHMRNSNDFFVGAKFKIQSQPNALTPTQLKELEKICQGYGLIICREQEKNKKTTVKKNNFFEIEGFSESELNTESHFLVRSIRSGDKLNIEGNAILFGDVNPGAYLAASGNIIVLGSVKGIVYAGVDGKESSYIIAFSLEPQQIRIGTKIACKTENEKSKDGFQPEIARIENNNIVIKPYLPKAPA